MTKQELETLAVCGLFCGIERPERMLGCLHGEYAEYAKNDILWRIGDPVHSCAVILSGSVRAETVNAAGQHTLMAHHGPGALVGDILMATPGGKSPVYVIASGDTTVLLLPFQQIMGGCANCCPEHLRLRENLISEIARKYWAQRQRMGCLAQNSLRSRIAMYLLERAGTTDTPFSLGIRREDMADYLCVNRSAMSRELSRMKTDGLIDFYRDTFRLLDKAALQKLVP